MLRLALRKYSPYLDLGLPKLWPEWRALFTRTYLKEDFQAGLSSAGVVVPLSLAIALASSVPPGVGLLTAILGGIVSSLFGGTPLAVSGPSAAMSILVGSVVQNHGFNYLLVVLFCCGILQLLGGIFGLGKLIQFIPIPVVSGFTAGIGAILAINQLPRAMGLPAPDQSQTIFVITHIKNYLYQTQPAALGLSLGTLGLTLLLRRGAPRLPAALIAMGLMTLLGMLFGAQVDMIGTLPRVFPSLSPPMWPPNVHLDLLHSTISFALLASMETLLSVQSLGGRVSGTKADSNQELIGQGLGNILSGLFGGMPMASSLNRSELHVKAGAKTRRAGLIHSLIILGFVLAFAPWGGFIPIAVLAGVLLSVALKMLSPYEFLYLWRISRADAVIYLTTFVAIIFMDLLAGVQAGLLAAFTILALRLGQARSLFHSSEASGHARFAITGAITFMSSNKINMIREKLENSPPGLMVSIDLARVTIIDASGAAQILDLADFLLNRKIRFALQGLSPSQQDLLKARDPRNILEKAFALTESDVNRMLHVETANQKTRSSSMDRLVFGVERFRLDSQHRFQTLFEQLAYTQSPHTLFITCSDSRIIPGLITSTAPGELFVVRNVGNIIPLFGSDDTPAEGAAVEFAIGVLGVKEIVVCGHSECGAMKALVANQPLPQTPNLEKWLSNASGMKPYITASSTADHAAKRNTLVQIEHLKTYPGIREKLASGEIRIHSWFYTIGTGEIEEWDEEISQFAPVGRTLDLSKHSTAPQAVDSLLLP